MSKVSLGLRPYILSSFYNWCINNNQQPMVEVVNSVRDKIPYSEKNDAVIFNIHPIAVRDIKFNNKTFSFKATFNGIEDTVEIFYESLTEIFTKDESCSIDMEQIELDSHKLNVIK